MVKTCKIALIDDDDVFHYLTKKYIKAVKNIKDVLSFFNGQEGIDFLTDNLANSEQLPDIILLDMQMPILDGFEFLEEYKIIKGEMVKKIPIYLCTSSINPHDEIRANNTGEIEGFIVKPVTVEVFENILKSHGF